MAESSEDESEAKRIEAAGMNEAAELSVSEEKARGPRMRGPSFDEAKMGEPAVKMGEHIKNVAKMGEPVKNVATKMEERVKNELDEGELTKDEQEMGDLQKSEGTKYRGKPWVSSFP